MRVAVVGAGLSGLVSAYVLAKEGVNVTLYEKEDYLRGQAKTVNVEGLDLDLGFMVFNRVAYPNMMEFFGCLGVDLKLLDMSFGVSLDGGSGYEWGNRYGLTSLFAQKRNLINPYFWQMVKEIINFKDDIIRYLDMLDKNPNMDHNETLEQFIKSKGYSELFVNAYFIPICGSIWPCSFERIMGFSAFLVLSFIHNLQHLQLFGRLQWVTINWRSQTHVKKVKEGLVSQGVHVMANCEVELVSTEEKGCVVQCKDGSKERYDGCIIATNAPNTLRLLGDEATYNERRILGAFQYVYNNVFLHHDKNLMPQNPAAWSAMNFLECDHNRVCVTYWLNILQNLDETRLPFLVTVNPNYIPENILFKWSTGLPVPSVAAFKASQELEKIQGKRRIWFCGAYQGCEFHKDGLKTGMVAAYGILGSYRSLWTNPKHMVMTQADLGLADAYINGDFTLDDKDKGLLNLFLIFIRANRDSNISNSKLKKNRGWWTPVLFTAGLSSAKFFLKHWLRKNTLTQARRNISRHYDLNEDEDLKDAQMRKISLLIEKVRAFD
ncbi:hypothetical protein PIB30_056803 [Stylosanthes scabra]|uniref:Amine oxidase domain-containing protein n=1 Tax=Stylosanthes scabra TaxID=79078 RepID=A0ABU6SK46_9FABA|nr:hypothetical protein [Stylosanthes scabra]